LRIIRLSRLDGAKPLGQNGYKLPLTRSLVRRALTALLDGERA